MLRAMTGKFVINVVNKVAIIFLFEPSRSLKNAAVSSLLRTRFFTRKSKRASLITVARRNNMALPVTVP